MNLVGRRSTIPFIVPLRQSPFRHVLDVIFSTLLALLPAAAQAACIRDIVVPAGANQPRIVAELWTPCASPPREMTIDRDGFPTVIRGARNCSVTRKKLPLIVISHGML